VFGKCYLYLLQQGYPCLHVSSKNCLA
jgi:hypothetical protein